jgi:hypothetical protein
LIVSHLYNLFIMNGIRSVKLYNIAHISNIVGYMVKPPALKRIAPV